MNKRHLSILIFNAMLGFSASATEHPDEIKRNILDTNRGVMGSVTLTSLGERGTSVEVKLNGLDGPGTHAMHFHEKSVCNAPDFKSAGGHFNPNETSHGVVGEKPHAGDMPNIEVGRDGNSTIRLINSRVSLHGEHDLPALFDSDGSALIIHEKADDYHSQPSGAAGARIGCAVLEPR